MDRKGLGRAGGIGWLVVVLVLPGEGAVRAQEFTDAISRKVSVLNGAGEFGDAVSRTIAVGNGTQEFVDANDRLLSVTTTLYSDAIARQVAVWNSPAGMVVGFGDASGRLFSVYVDSVQTGGSIVAWGPCDLDSALCAVPPPNSGFVAVATASCDNFGLKSDGTIVSWHSEDPFSPCPEGWGDAVPEPNSGFVAVSGGYYYSLGLRSNGEIVAWGALGRIASFSSFRMR